MSDPIHPKPSDMARAAYSGGRDSLRGVYANGVTAERARLRVYLLDLAATKIEAAKALQDPAPRGMSEAIEAAELVGEARALRELAAGLK